MIPIALNHAANAGKTRERDESGLWLEVVAGASNGIEISLGRRRTADFYEVHDGDMLAGPFDGFLVRFPDAAVLTETPDLELVVWRSVLAPPGRRASASSLIELEIFDRSGASGVTIAGLNTVTLFEIPRVIDNVDLVRQSPKWVGLGGFVSTLTGAGSFDIFLQESGPGSGFYPLLPLTPLSTQTIGGVSKRGASLYGLPYPQFGGRVLWSNNGSIDQTAVWRAYRCSRVFSAPAVPR